MTVIFSDGFETGNTSNWDFILQPTFVTVVTSPVHSGTYALHIANTEGAGALMLKSFTAVSKINVQAYFKIDSVTLSSSSGGLSCWTQLLAIVSANEELAILQLSNWQGGYAWTAAVYDSTGTLIYGSPDASFVLDFNKWYYVEIEYDHTTNILNLYVDGVLTQSASGGAVTTGLPAGVIINNWTSGVTVMNVDDIIISSDTTPPPVGLSAVVAPASIAVQVGNTVTLSTVISGGTAPYSVVWKDGVSNAVLGSGTTLAYTAVQAGTYSVYVTVTDSANATVNSAYATVTASTTPVTPVRSGQAVIYGHTYLGYAETLPKQATYLLWRLREKFISKEVHKKLHPLI